MEGARLDTLFARHYAESGRREDALRQFDERDTLLREMGMDFWLPHVSDLRGRLETGDLGASPEQRVA